MRTTLDGQRVVVGCGFRHPLSSGFTIAFERHGPHKVTVVVLDYRIWNLALS